jgi:hypothetical protein
VSLTFLLEFALIMIFSLVSSRQAFHLNKEPGACIKLQTLLTHTLKMYKQFTGAALRAIGMLLSISGAVLAGQSAETAAAPDQPVPTVAVTGTKDPDWKPYRKMLDGMNAFDKFHALAPQAELKFILRPQKPDATIDDLKLRIVGDHSSIDIPIAADSSFSLPRDESAAQDDADLRLNAKKGLFRWRPHIETAGLPPGTRRLGDLRLECEVRWAIDKFEASFLQLAYLVPLGGVCHTSRSRIFYGASSPILSATLVSGARREKLPAERMNRYDRTRYAPPLHDGSWPDDTLVEFEFLAPASAPLN